MKWHSVLLMFVAASALALAAGCNPSDDAGSGTHIDTGRGYGEACEIEVNCRKGLSCLEGLCMPKGDTALGAECALTEECLPDLYCAPILPADAPAPGVVSVCATSGTTDVGGACASTANCLSGLVCGPVGFGLECKATGTLDIGGACTDTTECLAGLGCFEQACTPGIDSLIPPTWIPSCEVDENTNLRVYFEVPQGEVAEFFRLPFPNDIRLKNGHPDLSGHPTPPLAGYAGPIVEEYVQRIQADLDGFSQNPVITFRFSGTIDLSSLKDGSDKPRFEIYDVTPGAEQYGQQLGLAWSVTTGVGSRGLYVCDNHLSMRLAWGRPLRPGHTYAAIVKRGIRGGDAGPEFGQDTDFATMISVNRPGDSLLSEAWDKYEPMRTFMTDQALTSNDVVGGTVFTTQTTEALVPKIREAVRAVASPTITDLTLCDGVASTVSPCDDGLEDETHERGCFAVSPDFYELQGKMALPRIQAGTPPFYTIADGGGVETDASGMPILQGEDSVCVSMTVPKSLTMPAEGWPLVIYAHGSGGTYRSHADNDLSQILSTLDHEGTAAGAIVLGFDQVMHGDRTAGSDISPNNLYFNFLNPKAGRGHVYQGMADLFTLARLGEDGFTIAEADSHLGSELRIDPTKVYLVAHSQGTHYGAVILPFEPNFTATVLTGAGGGLIRSILDKTEPINISAGVRLALSDPSVDEFHPALNLVQTYFDGVDAINYAESVLIEPFEGKERPHVFHVFGIGDHYAPDATQQNLAVGLGTYLVTPAIKPFGGVNEATLPVSGNFGGATALVRQYEPDGYDGHFVGLRNDTARADLASFMSSLIALGKPTVK